MVISRTEYAVFSGGLYYHSARTTRRSGIYPVYFPRRNDCTAMAVMADTRVYIGGWGKYWSMRPIVIIGIVFTAGCAFLTGCGKQTPTSAALSPSEDARLFKLAQMTGCIECHTVTTASIGPSWMAVAARYKAVPRADTRALLIDSVMNGSKGKWIGWRGDEGMPPLRRRVVKEDVEELVDFILTLNP
jgi:cytochrome c551/c552